MTSLWQSSQCNLLANAVTPAETLVVSESYPSPPVILQSPTKFTCSLEAQLQKRGKSLCLVREPEARILPGASLISKSMETYQKIYIQRFSSCLFVLLLRPEV